MKDLSKIDEKARVLAAARDLMARGVYPSTGRLADATGLSLGEAGRWRAALVTAGKIPGGDDSELPGQVLEVCRDMVARGSYPTLDAIAAAVRCARPAARKARDILIERGDLDRATLQALAPRHLRGLGLLSARDARCLELCRALIARGIRPTGVALAREAGGGSDTAWRHRRNRLIARGELAIPDRMPRASPAPGPDADPEDDAAREPPFDKEAIDAAIAELRGTPPPDPAPGTPPPRPPAFSTDDTVRAYRKAWRSVRCLLAGAGRLPDPRGEEAIR